MSWRRHAATLAFFTAFAIVHTWPLAAAPRAWSRIDNGDYSLNAWILAWVAHQAVRDPVHLFDANIFYPEPRTLAFSEHLVPQAAVAAPVIWAGGSAVLACNLTLLAGFVLTGWAMTVVMTRWTSDWSAGLLAGSLLAFNAHTLTRLTHVQAQHNQFLPLALASFDVLLTTGRWRASLATGSLAALQALTSGYQLAFTALAMTAAALVRFREWWRARPVPVLGAAMTSAVLLVPFLVPYWLARHEQGLVRSFVEVRRYSATWVDYITTGGRLHMMTPLAWGYESGLAKDAFFPGITATVLTVVALATGLAWRDRRARMYLALGVGGLLLSLGSHLPIYGWLFEHVALLQGIRAPSRFGWLVLVSVAGLAGFALAWMKGRLVTRSTGRRRPAVLLGIAVILLVHLEALRSPLLYQRYRGESAVYEVVAQLPGRVVLAEFPFYRPSDFYQNARYMLSSTLHWKPMLNGYSGFLPAGYRAMAEAMGRFPEPPTLDLLRRAGVTHIIVHRNRFGARRDLLLRQLERSGEVEPVASDPQVRLYRLLPR
jgi:hypothetical protein